MSRNCCGKQRKPLRCCFPPCPCEKCKLKRVCGVLDRDQQDQAVQKCKNRDKAAKRNFSAFISELFSIVAFFIIATAMFWLAVIHHLFVMAVKIQKSNRNVKLAALVLASLLFLSVAFKVVRRAVQLKCQARARARARAQAAAAVQKQKQQGKEIACLNLPKGKSKSSRLAGGGGGDDGSGGSFGSRWRRSKQNEAITTATTGDSKAREVFKQSKLYAIPAEMKQPPGFLVYLREVVLRHSPLH